jgi:hypothetical protein
MKRCWAACLGNCSRAMSREHIISQSVFKDTKLLVEGVPWLGTSQARQLGRSALTGKVLCKYHNEQLSALDKVAGQLSAALRALFASQRTTTLSLDGWLYERWCLKVLLNICTSGWATGRMAVPAQEFVEVAFGRRRLDNGAGLYLLDVYSGRDTGADRFQWNILLDSHTRSQVCGIITSLRGFVTMLTIRKGNPEPLISSLGKVGSCDLANVRLQYRPKAVSYKIHETSAELAITIGWA